MGKVAFKKGLLASLPAALSAGTIYVTTDERALYLDVDGSTRVRIGDFQEFDTLAALQANTNPSATALYYVTELNCLAKWDGTKYVQINLDTGATAVNVTGDGNAITGVTYDAATRTLTFTKTTAFATPGQVDEKVTAKAEELKGYVDEKTEGIASDAVVSALAERVTAAESALDKLNGGAEGEGSVDKKIADTVGELPEGKTVVQVIEEAKAAATYDDTELSGKVNTLIGTDTGKSARTIANEELAKQLIPEGAKESLDTLAEIAAWIQAHPDDASAMNAAIAKLQAVLAGIGGDSEKATVTAYVTDAIAALSIGDYAKAADLTAAVARITALEGKSHEHANAAELAKIAEGDKEKWDAAEQNAKDYVDAALEWGTF